jgi:hypothetical protein
MAYTAGISDTSVYICHMPETVGFIYIYIFFFLIVRNLDETVPASNPSYNRNVSQKFVTELPPAHYTEHVGVGVKL